jgi:hypothetical protein
VITRKDISFGYQGVQGMHSAIQFIFEHPEFAREWYHNSNYLGFLSVADEQELHQLAERAESLGLKYSIFKEPDIGDQATAIALEPGAKSKKLCANLSLALREALK